MTWLNFDNLKFRYEPFPIGVTRPAMDEGTYRQLVDGFPSLDLFEDYRKLGKDGNKFTLSERENEKAYKEFIHANPLWRDFYQWIKSDEFIYGVLDVLLQHNIDLGYRYIPPAKRALNRAKGLLRGYLKPEWSPLSTRFEFSALPANGGKVVPHTDSVSKVVTLIVSMEKEGEWNPAFGGGTDINRHRNPSQSFNHVNRLAPFEDMEVLDTIEYAPNQAVMFIRTFNSWHSVRPMKGSESDPLRKTLTIVIETPR